MTTRIASAALVLLLPSVAQAGREPFTKVLDNEVLPARGAELLGRITDDIGGEDETASWWGAAFGLSNQVELVLPVEIAYSHTEDTTRFTWYAAELRWRIAKPGPPPGPGHPVPLVRLSVEKSNKKRTFTAAGDLVIGTDLSKAVHTSVMVGAEAVLDGSEVATRGGLGVTGNVTGSLRIGGEVFGQVPILPSGETPSVGAGPAVSYTSGPFWITVGGLIGLQPAPLPVLLRLGWGVEF